MSEAFKNFISLLPLPFPLPIAEPSITNPMFGPFSASKTTEIFWRMKELKITANLNFIAWDWSSGSAEEITSEVKSWNFSTNGTNSLCTITPHKRLLYNTPIATCIDPQSASNWAIIDGPYYAKFYPEGTPLENMEFYYQPDIVFTLASGLSLSTQRFTEGSGFTEVGNIPVRFFGSTINLTLMLSDTYTKSENISYDKQGSCNIITSLYTSQLEE